MWENGSYKIPMPDASIVTAAMVTNMSTTLSCKGVAPCHLFISSCKEVTGQEFIPHCYPVCCHGQVFLFYF